MNDKQINQLHQHIMQRCDSLKDRLRVAPQTEVESMISDIASEYSDEMAAYEIAVNYIKSNEFWMEVGK